VNPRYLEGAPMPESLGACADEIKEVDALASAMQKEVDKVKARKRELENHLIDNLDKSNDGGAVGLKYMARVVTEPTPKVEDWDALRQHILNTGDWELLTRSIKAASVREAWDAGVQVPGVGTFNRVKLSIKKL